MLLKSITPSNKFDINISFRIIFNKIYIIEINVIKIYTKNIDFINKNCDIIKVFNNKDYITSFLITLFVTIQLETNFKAGRKSSTALSLISRVLYLLGQYFSIKGELWFFDFFPIADSASLSCTSESKKF